MASPAPRQVALNLVIGADGAERIEVLRRRLRNAGLGASDVPPHVTIAVLEDADPAAIAGVFTRPPPATLQMVHLGAFFGPPGVVFLGVAPSVELVDLHASTWAAVAGMANGWPLYEPGCWVPHCTLAMPLGPVELGRAVTLLGDADLPFRVDVAGLAVADLHSGRTLSSTWPAA